MKFAALICLAVCVGMCGFAFWLSARSLKFIRANLRADARVVEVKSRPGRKSTMYSPVVEFVTGSGTVRYESNQSSSSPVYSVGDVISVAYRAENPSDARIATVSEVYGLPSMFALMGLMFGGAGLLLVTVVASKAPVW